MYNWDIPSVTVRFSKSFFCSNDMPLFAVVRIAAAVHETLGLTLEEMKESIKAIGFHTCGGTAGWRRAVYLDMTDPNTNCPSG